MLIRICKIQYNRNTKSWVSMVLIQPWWKMSTIFGILCWTMNLWLQAYFKYTYSKNLCNSPNLGTQLKKICFFKKITLFCLRYCNICDCCFSLLFVCLFVCSVVWVLFHTFCWHRRERVIQKCPLSTLVTYLPKFTFTRIIKHTLGFVIRNLSWSPRPHSSYVETPYDSSVWIQLQQCWSTAFVYIFKHKMWHTISFLINPHRSRHTCQLIETTNNSCEFLEYARLNPEKFLFFTLSQVKWRKETKYLSFILT